MTSQREHNRRALNTDHLAENLGRRTILGGVVAVAAQPIRMLIQFVTTAILARLLVPADFGLVAMATAVTSFIGIFSEFGLTSATVQRSQIDQDTVSGLFFITVGIGCLLVPVVCGLAPLAAWFFDDPRVSGVIMALSIAFPLAALGSQHTALLLRSMRWMALQGAGLLGHASGAAAGLLIAWKTDLGYWSLVVTVLVANVVTLSTLWTVCRWRPSRVSDWRGARSALHFGVYLTGFSVVNFFHRQLDNIIIGSRFGASELGYYSRSYQLMLMPLNLFNGPLSSSVEPSLSRLQNEPERWRQALLDALGLVMFLGAGVAAGLIAGSGPLITIVYGPGWEKSVTIFQWLAASIFAGVPINAAGWIYMSLGRTKQMFIWSLAFVPMIGAGFLIAAPYGAVGIAAAYAVVLNILLIPCFAFATRGTPVSLGDTLKVILPLGLAGAIAALAGLLVSQPGSPALLQLLATATTSGLVYLALAGSIIARADVYAALRTRISTQLSDILGRIMEKAGPRSAS
ncbi:lipopolysaccharide biosynthesis protein [Bradyrhizobium sp. STM 3809]|uniref:lipopolysaccharide biosynthesis protein n=1 Tax=Bradyrhizobium sp. STM 3809 TaxID=551936 RepID=UPI00024065A9|nr:lipopolysaccharide biosynthesis protein [Bradyrhizobium sp. STM 3809]CCD99473.1 putative succinoglycan transport protein [Bradyrhizobium sp. STM 3809]